MVVFRLCRHLLLLAVVLLPAFARAETALVGQYSFVVGSLTVSDSQGNVRTLVSVGDEIFEGDKILTGDDGVAHLQFIDGASVSLRPNSELRIEHYRFNRMNPAESQIKLDLIRGVARSISGKGAEAAKDKFRLNTPVAAIGVRGTDFVVAASNGMMQAIVNSGGIVVAAFSSSCRRIDFGPCEAGIAELYAGDSRAVQVTNDSLIPQFIQVDSELLKRLSQAITPVPSDAGRSGTTTEKRQNALEPNEDETVGDIQGDYRPVIYGISLSRGVGTVEVEPLQVDSGDQVLVRSGNFGSQPLESRKMVWGRWFADVQPSDQLVVSSAQARLGRQAVLGTRNFGLYRTNGTGRLEQAPSRLEFELTGLDATLSIGERVRSLGALDSDLFVDLRDGSFSTQLDLYDPQVGVISVESSGFLTDRGTFVEKKPGQWVAGALDLSGKEAGYFFEKVTSELRVDGLTLWNAQ